MVGDRLYDEVEEGGECPWLASVQGMMLGQSLGIANGGIAMPDGTGCVDDAGAPDEVCALGEVSAPGVAGAPGDASVLGNAGADDAAETISHTTSKLAEFDKSPLDS